MNTTHNNEINQHNNLDNQKAALFRLCGFDDKQCESIGTQLKKIELIMGPEVLAHLFTSIDNIHAKIKSEKLPTHIKDKIIDKIIKLSPKRTGTYLEVSCRGHNEFTKATSVSHDAQNKDLEKIEIKASRVLIDKVSVLPENDLVVQPHLNLYDEFLNEERTLANFSQLLTNTSYDCNIQQVKPKEFKDLIYNVFLNEIILEFKISSQELELIHNSAVVAQLEKKTTSLNLKARTLIGEALTYFSQSSDKNAKQLCKNLVLIQETVGRAMEKNKYLFTLEECLEKFATTLTKKSDIAQLEKISAGYRDETLLKAHFMRSMLSYSNKQHRGNVGEGQFHIQSSNVLYHLANHFEAAYTYHDFVEKLKSESLKNQKSDTIEKISPQNSINSHTALNNTHEHTRKPKQKSLW